MAKKYFVVAMVFALAITVAGCNRKAQTNANANAQVEAGANQEGIISDVLAAFRAGTSMRCTYRDPASTAEATAFISGNKFRTDYSADGKTYHATFDGETYLIWADGEP